MEDGYLVLDGFEKGTEAQVSCVEDPLVPLTITGGGAASRDSLVDVVRSKAEITHEVIGGRACTSFQGSFCGKKVSK